LFGQSPTQKGGDAQMTEHIMKHWFGHSNVSGLPIKMVLYQRESIVPNRPKILHHIMPEERIERLKIMILVRE
jgi:hypothetical protein